VPDFTPVKTRRGKAWSQYQEHKSKQTMEVVLEESDPNVSGTVFERRAPQEPAAEQTEASVAPSSKEIAAAQAARDRLAGNAPNALAGEKLPDGPEPTREQVEYLARGQLAPLADPEAACSVALESLSSPDWLVICEGLLTVRRAAAHHPGLLRSGMEAVVRLVGEHVRSRRSGVSKSALLCVSDLAHFCGPDMDAAMFPATAREDEAPRQVDVVLEVVTKSVDVNKFIAAAADAALAEVAATCDFGRIRAHLAGMVEKHRNFKVRAKAGEVMATAAAGSGGAGADAVKAMLSVAARLLADKAPGRTAAKRLGTAAEAFCRGVAGEEGLFDRLLEQAVENPASRRELVALLAR